MYIPSHDKAAEYRRLAVEARTMARQISIQDGRAKLLETARYFETLADLEERGVRQTVPVQSSKPERQSAERHSMNADPTASPEPRPRYFFDSDDGERFISDEVGLEVAELAAAKELACRALGDMARDGLTCADQRELSVSVRDEAGEVVFQATPSLAVRSGLKLEK